MQSQSPVLDRRQLRLAESVGAGHAPPARVAVPFTVADGLPLLSRASNVRLPASGFQPLPLCGFNFLRDVESRCKLRGGYHCGNKSNVAWSNPQDVRDRAVSLQPSDRDVDAGPGMQDLGG